MRNWLASICLALGLALTLTGCRSGGDPQELLTAAQSHQARGDHAAAIIELRNLLAIEPRNVDARHLLATSYNADNQPQAAEDEIRKAIEDGADPRRFRPTLARSLLFQGKNERLLEEIVPDPNESPTEALAISAARGLAYVALGRFTDAKVLLDRVVEAQPNHADALLGLAGITMAENRPDDAFKLVERAIAAAPRNVDAWLLKGEMLRLTKKLPDAIAAYGEVLKLEPNNLGAHMQLTSLHIDAQRFDEAGRHLEAVRSKVRNNALANYLFALIEFRKNNLTVARKAINEALQITPNHTPSLFLAGAIEYSSGAFDAAADRLRNLLDRAPGSIAARRMLAISLIQAGHVQRAIELIDQSLALAPDDPQLLTLLGEAHLHNADLQRALPPLEKAAKVDPRNTEAMSSLQVARLLGGQSERALADLESSLKIESPSLNRIELLYVAALVHRKQFAAALKAMPRLEKNQPNNPVTHNLKAAVLLAAGNPDAARRSLENAIALNPKFMPAIVNLTKLDLREKNARQARRRLELLLERDPANATALSAMHDLAPELGITNELFLEILERARRANPTSARVLVLLSNVTLKTGNAAKALQFAEAAQRSNPDQAEVLDALGAAQMALGRPSDALGSYSKLAVQNPQSPQMLFRLARAQAANANTAGATFTLRKALSIDPNFVPALVLLGEIELGANRLATALQIAGDLKKRYPKAPVGYLLEGDAQMAQQQHAAAIASFQAAMRLGERSGRTAIKISQSLAATGRSTEADSFLDKFISENPRESSAMAYRADSHLAAGRHDKAVDYYQRVLQNHPDNPLILNNLAWASFKLKDSRARQYAEKAHALAPQNPIVLDTYGWILAQTGELNHGIEILQRAVTNAPESRQTRYHLAQALLRAGQYGRGRKELEAALAGEGTFADEAAAKELLRTIR